MGHLQFPSSPAARERWAAIGLVALVAALCYGPLLPWLGFYRDDWYQIWAGTTLGPRSIVTLFSIDRPVMGYTYAATFFAIRDWPLAWQVYSLVLRCLGAIGALWLFRRLWPGRPFLTTSAALLFLVYPGFLQQPNANTFSNQLLSYTAEILSLAATAELLDMPRGWRRNGLTVFAVAGAADVLAPLRIHDRPRGLTVLPDRPQHVEGGRTTEQTMARPLPVRLGAIPDSAVRFPRVAIVHLPRRPHGCGCSPGPCSVRPIPRHHAPPTGCRACARFRRSPACSRGSSPAMRGSLPLTPERSLWGSSRPGPPCSPTCAMGDTGGGGNPEPNRRRRPEPVPAGR